MLSTMKGYGDSRWHEECFDRCGGCSSCLHSNNINNGTSSIPSKRFVTLGSVRYGVRLGAVSPPPPGAGPRYRSQCCWPSASNPGLVSRIPLLAATPPINSSDIYKRVDRMRMLEDDTSELPDPATIIRDQVVHSTKSLLKNQLRRRAVIRPQVSYARLCDCGNGERTDIVNTLDRLPRFRFGGNRNNNTGKERELDKKAKELRLRELTDRLKKCPVPPPRTKHALTTEILETPTAVTQDVSECNTRTVPLRSASFSQVEYSSDGKKYIRKKCVTEPPVVFQTAKQESQTSPQHVHHKTALVQPLNFKTPETHEISDEFTFLPQNLCFSGNLNGICESTQECAFENISCDNKNTIKECPRCNEPDDNASPQNIQERKRDKSRRRKGMYISQWPNSSDESETTLPLNCEYAACESLNAEIPKLKISVDKSDSESSNKLDKTETPENLSPEYDDSGITFTPNLCNQDTDEKSSKNLLLRSDSLTEGTTYKHDHQGSIPSDLSDCEVQPSLNKEAPSHSNKRYWKRPLRGPYGQMLEAEMKKPETGRKLQYNNELKFLEAMPGPGAVSLSSSSSVGAGDPRPKCVIRIRGPSNHSLDDSDLKCLSSVDRPELHQNSQIIDSQSSLNEPLQNLVVSHQRTTSSPSKLGIFTPPEASTELLEELLSGSSEHLAATVNLQRHNDTRTHVVIELYDTELSYVESLHTLVSKYLEPLKSQENVGLIEPALVDEIFYQIPALLGYHKVFLDELRRRMERWDIRQKIGDLFMQTFSKPAVSDSYTNYVNNWKRARDALKNAQSSKPAFARFLEATAREHKGKLALDSLLIKPIQKFPKYELLLQRLIKHTDVNHPDHDLLLDAQHEVHEQLLKINSSEREAVEAEQLREIQASIEGLTDLVAAGRQYLRHDLVTMMAGGGARKERALFLFSDLVLITSIKRKSGTIKKAANCTPNPPGPPSVANLLEANKYKLLMRVSLDNLEILKPKDDSLKELMLEIEALSDDMSILHQVHEICWGLHCNHSHLDEVVRDLFDKLNKQLAEHQNNNSQLCALDLAFTTANNSECLSFMFTKPEKRVSWEESFTEAKIKLATSGDRRPPLDLIATVPIRKTRAGLQFTCAAPAISDNRQDVWVCNSDGYVGQVCVLSLTPEPNVASCNGVCNARILCITLVPGVSTAQSLPTKDIDGPEVQEEQSSMQFDSSSSSEEDDQSDVDEQADFVKISSAAKVADAASIDSEEGDSQQSTMWLGTEDGCIHVYNSNDNIRTKKNKIKLQHGSAILSIVYLEDKVYVSLGNGDIVIYERESNGIWNTMAPITISVGTTAMPVSKMVPSAKKLWCGCGNTIKIFNTETLTTEHNVNVNNDVNKPINCVVLSGNALWLSLQNSAIVKCFHTISFELLCEVNVAPAVTKMLTSCDDIIRQHKAACLRVTALLACKDLLWIGTSAGVLLTMSLPHITPTTTKIINIPSVVGVSHGHTGHARFLTNVEYQVPSATEPTHNRNSCKGKPEQRNSLKLLVISGGDGYEDFRNSNISEVAGREDSTNHLLLWNV